jgi:hypothetical protein
MNSLPEIYLGTVLLEVNRWGGDGQPSFLVSDWTRRLADEGFDGLELWQNHALRADAEEVARLQSGPCPVKVFNAYDVCEPETGADRRRIAEVAAGLGAWGMKYNFGKAPERMDSYVEALREWKGMFPEGFRFLCECHRGSGMEDSALAAKTFDRLEEPGFEAIIHGMDNPEEAVRERFGAYGGRITHIHANLSSKGLMTEAQVCERLTLLRSLGFRGTFTIEFTEGVRDGLTIEALYRNAVRDFRLLRSCLEKVPLAP